MRIFNIATLRKFEEKHPNARPSLREWYQIARVAQWGGMNDLSQVRFSPSPVGKDRIVFDINGNHCRLLVRVDFQRKALFLLWFGTHAEYDRINAKTIRYPG